MGNTNLTLRPHQVSGLNELRKGWKKHRRHLLQAPTGSGKTAIAAEIAAGCVNNGMRVIFIAPYVALIEQTAKAFMDYGMDQPAVIWQQHEWTDPSNPLQIASADTLTRRQMPDVDVIIVDECHIRRKTLLQWQEDTDAHVIGLSATPFTKWLGKHYENFIKVCTVRELIDAGHLSDFEVYAPTKPNMKGVKVSNTAAFGSDYNEEQVAEIMNDSQIVGDLVQNWLENGENEPTIAFCVNVLHANHVTIEFQKSGVNAEVMTAKTPVDERKRIVGRFEQGITKVICNVGVLVAGFDSDVRCIIYARPTKSEIRWIQCIGRGLRTAKGKKRCLVFDHSGTVHRLGFPDQIEYDCLLSEDDGMSEVERTKKEIEKIEKKPKECTKCNYMKPAGIHICPMCGHQPIMGEDVDVDDTRQIEKLKGKSKVFTKQDKQDFYSEIYHYYRQKIFEGKSWKEGWVSNKYREKFGVWPQGLLKTGKTPTPETLNFIKSRNIASYKSRRKTTAEIVEDRHAYRASQEDLLR